MFDKNFKKFLLSFISELNVVYGFKISTDRTLSLFKLYGKYDFFNEEEARNVLMSILCQNQEEQHLFNQAFYSYFKKAKEAAADDVKTFYIEDIMKELERLQQENEIQAIQENAAFSSEVLNIEANDDLLNQKLKEIVDKVESKDATVLYNVLIKDGSQIHTICLMELYKRDIIIRQIEQEIQDVMIYAIENNAGSDITEAILDSIQTLQKYVKEYTILMEKQKKSIEDISKEYIKVTSLNHRDVYTEGHNAVQTQHGYLYKDFSELSDKDLNQISGYIKRNALTIKTKIAKSMKKKTLPKLDYKKTMKSAAKTDMVPIELFFKKQRKEKKKIICITDISGSCKNASQILMTFIYALQEAFPGGVESYVFVRQLSDATDIFRNYSLKEANARTSVLVERDYSSYYDAFKQFDEEYFDRVTKDTIVIYLGDARNNNNEPGAEYLKKVHDKVKRGSGKTLWLNPEPKYKWTKGDSVMTEYKKYLDVSFEVLNTIDLIHFLDIMFS